MLLVLLSFASSLQLPFEWFPSQAMWDAEYMRLSRTMRYRRATPKFMRYYRRAGSRRLFDLNVIGLDKKLNWSSGNRVNIGSINNRLRFIDPLISWFTFLHTGILFKVELPAQSFTQRVMMWSCDPLLHTIIIY